MDTRALKMLRFLLHKNSSYNILYKHKLYWKNNIIHFQYHLYCLEFKGERRGPPWTDHQSVTSKKKKTFSVKPQHHQVKIFSFSATLKFQFTQRSFFSVNMTSIPKLTFLEAALFSSRVVISQLRGCWLNPQPL